MLTKEINDNIRKIQETAAEDNEKAMELLRELLIRLMEEDCFFILADPAATEEQVQNNVFLPYVLDLSGYPFFRVFSSEDAAEAFVEHSRVKPTIVSLETIPFIQFCKYWLMMGIGGFVLNDGQPSWCAVQFSQTLQVFFNDVLGHPEDIDKDFFLLLGLCDHLYNGNAIGIGENGEVNTEGEGLRITQDSFPQDDMSIHMNGVDTSIFRLESLFNEVQALRDDDTGMAPTHLSLPASKNYPFRSMEPNLVLKETEQVSEKAGESKESSTENKKPAFKRPEFKIPALMMLPKTDIKKAIRLAAAVVAGLAVAAVMALGTVQHSNVKLFRTYCENQSYQDAVQWYVDHSNPIFRMGADKALPDVYKNIYARYLNGETSYNETVASLKIMAQLPEMDTVSEGLIEKVNEAENSKLAYEAGKHAEDTMSRLVYWQDVKETDEVRYNFVISDIDIHSSQYKRAMLKTADALSLAGHKGQAKWCLELLCQWYPELKQDKDVGVRLLTWDDIESEAVTIAPALLDGTGVYTTSEPIEVSGIHTKSHYLEERVDLYVRWRNTGSKVIQEVAFFVVPLDEFGNVLSEEMLYCARDVGPYQPSEGTPSSTWAWENVWTSSRISGAKLETVIVSFEDGSVKIIEDADAILA